MKKKNHHLPQKPTQSSPFVDATMWLWAVRSAVGRAKRIFRLRCETRRKTKDTKTYDGGSRQEEFELRWKRTYLRETEMQWKWREKEDISNEGGRGAAGPSISNTASHNHLLSVHGVFCDSHKERQKQRGRGGGDTGEPRRMEGGQQEAKTSKFRRICVFCGSSQGKKSSYQDAAIELGKELVCSSSSSSSSSLRDVRL
ncbi:hypothetical protein GW17_00040944 [Ensete ventricosum]|nr:hypothetical protein GW17_00040944 [Ensete ventricosum]